MRMQRMGMAVALAAALWAAAPAGAESEEEAMAVFTMSDKEHTCVQVRAGETFALKFLTSPGTGYGWELAAPLDGTMLVLEARKSEPTASGLLGASEHEIWTCRALQAGKAEIAMKYVRPWEKEAEPAKKHVFRVRIR